MRLRLASVTALAAAAAVPAAAGAADRLPLPAGWQPEGIAAAPGGDLYVGSVATGDVLRLDPRTGRSRTVFDAPDGAATNGLERFGKGLVVMAGNRTGTIRAFRERDGGQVFVARPAPAGEESFTNDVAVAGKRAYVTDSSRPVLYAVTRRGAARSIPLQGVAYEDGINLNGIVAARGGKRLYAVQSNTGRLYRLRAGSGKATAVDTGGYSLAQGDGLELRGRELFVVQNRIDTVAVLRLSRDGRRARLVRRITGADVDVPTTAAFLGNRLFAVNARFGTPSPEAADYWVTPLGRQR